MVDRSTIPGQVSSGTILVMYSPLGLPLYSARDLEQTLEAIPERDQAERNINGNLVDLNIPGLFEKYISNITCTDMHAPMIDGVWQGDTVVIDCCCELPFPMYGTPSRPLATNTSVRTDAGGTNFYYPKITFMIRSIKFGFKEYPHKYNWAIGVEEV